MSTFKKYMSIIQEGKKSTTEEEVTPQYVLAKLKDYLPKEKVQLTKNDTGTYNVINSTETAYAGVH